MSAIAVLTFNRLHAITTMVEGLVKHCGNHEIAIFEDFGCIDNTSQFLISGATLVKFHPQLSATEWLRPDGIKVFIGDRNVGVAGNSNRALRWFEGTSHEHLCLCNDDLHVLGDFATAYEKAHADIHVGLLSFNDFDPVKYGVTEINHGDYTVKICARMTGIMMSLTRSLFLSIGYFNTDISMFGNEHCAYNIRARIAGFITFHGENKLGLDFKHELLRHQDVESSVTGSFRQQCDAQAEIGMRNFQRKLYACPLYVPFMLDNIAKAGAQHGEGADLEHWKGYTVVNGR